MEHSSAMPTIMDISMAARFMTGSEPGRPRTSGSMRVLGGAPSFSGVAPLGGREIILERVASSTWISRPTLSCVLTMEGMWDDTKQLNTDDTEGSRSERIRDGKRKRTVDALRRRCF